MSESCKFIVKSQYDLFPWVIGSYIQSLSINYLKILSILKICELYDKDKIDDDMIYIEKNSFYHHRKIDILQRNAKLKVFLHCKGNDPDEFWKILSKNPRPLVYLKKDGIYKPLFLINNNEIIISKVVVESPPRFDIIGSIKILSDLLLTKKRNAREHDKHINEQLGQTIRNMADLMRASEIIEKVNIPEGIKSYAINTLNQVIEAQERQNEKNGISPSSIDIEI